ncbi:HD domain-containing protein C4G3.17 [Dichanthelium oligosanthes]|uniref:5'-deoxynucleotidase n=1 Tax=Dichanthelium oligosanthes TaxID=888268 RepID=A0A1E5VSS0_9POAL|nr:HD domain-containing protein C4G3.17 [Dichanthelium oligosanthes]
MGCGSRALSLSSLCATTLLAAASARPPLPFPLAPAPHRALPLRLASAAAMSSSSSSPTPAAPGDAAAAPAPSASSAIDFLTLCYRLKTTKRAGWVKRGVQAPESVADHMYRMGVMALVAADLPGVNRDRCVKMAIVHDIAEAIVGDITPSDNVPKEEKSRMEKEALDHMCELLGGGSRGEYQNMQKSLSGSAFGRNSSSYKIKNVSVEARLRTQEIRELWMEYEENASLEAKVVKDFDKIEMILQAMEYEKEQGQDLEEFFQSTAGKFQTDIGKAWAAEIASRRKTK